MPLRFRDFTQKQLLGMSVVWSTKDQRGVVKQISTIRCTGKLGFQINGSDCWFTYTGQQRDFKTSPHRFSICQLISDQQKQQLEEQWKLTKEKLALINLILLSDLKKVDIESLRQFASKISGTDNLTLDVIDNTLTVTVPSVVISNKDKDRTVELMYETIQQETHSVIRVLQEYCRKIQIDLKQK